ncbi:MAG: hypothetical protein RL442_19 [Pseudomonadota bacterium]|jgi:hypothetical protein
MAKVATPTFTPAGGQVGTSASFEIACATSGSTIYYTYGDTDPSTTNWTAYSGAVNLPTQSGQNVVVRAFAVKSGSDNSDVATATFNTIGFSSAVGADAVAILDTNTTQGLGSVCEGIGKSGSDGTSIGGWRIGASGTTTNLKYETGSI